MGAPFVADGRPVTVGPVRLEARLDEHLSRWLWLVKWLLVIPHLIVLTFLWAAFAVLSLGAFVAILFTGHYPEPIFEFNTGVLRWSWRVAYYAYGALGTDRYPPFTLAEVPDYPATLQIAHPERLSRGLVLVKWWLLALPHYLVLAFFVGGGTYAVRRIGDWTAAEGGWVVNYTNGGLIGLLVLIAGVVLLFTGRYPRGVFDLVLGLQRWVLRVVAYAALMTDEYPPFRLDTGGHDSSVMTVPAPTSAPTSGPVAAPGGEVPAQPQRSGGGRWTPARIVSVVLGSLLLTGSLGLGAGATALMVADQAGRDATGYLTTPAFQVAGPGYALQFDAVDLRDRSGDDAVDAASFLGDVRLRAVAGTEPVFIGIGPAAEVNRYLAGVDHTVLGRVTGRDQRDEHITGGAPAGPPAAQDFWVASAAGPGRSELAWSATEGDWSVVVMNTDAGRPVSAEVRAALSAPYLRPLWIALFIGAGVTLVVGVALVGIAIPRRPRA